MSEYISIDYVVDLEKRHLERTDELAARCGRLRFLVEFALRRATHLRGSVNDDQIKLHVIDAILKDIEATLTDGLEKANCAIRSAPDKVTAGDSTEGG